MEITLIGERPTDQLVLPTEADGAAGATGSAFRVCREGSHDYCFTGGVLEPNQWMTIQTYEPRSINIYVDTKSWLWPYEVCVDMRDQQAPFLPPGAPSGTYLFTDETGDAYKLEAILPMLHTVGYSSDKPNIVDVRFRSTIFGTNYWSDAPQCH
jgi:hypothetical protein